jgi:pimeloyl-ACP methyl ester carboxylesterase
VIETSTRFKPFPERVLELGEGRSLIAIASDADAPSASKPAVVMLNAGVLHRVGPHRLHVKLARELASRGFPTCRVDLSGIGDSRPITGDISFRESAVADTRTVMDELARDRGPDRFAIFGLCSGADNALAVAAKDPRVAAVALLDAHCYPTRRAYVREFMRRLAQSGSLALLRSTGAAGARFFARAFRPTKEQVTQAGREPPPRSEFGKLIGNLVARGTKVLFVYSATMQLRCNHKGQLFELFPDLRGRVDVEYFGDADHVFTEVAAQKRMMDTVVGWLAKAFP